MEVALVEEVKKALDCKTLEYFYSSDFGSANAGLFSDWRQKLQIEIDNRLAEKNSYCSVSHSKTLGGAAFIAHDEGQIGLLTDEYYFTKNINFNKEELHWLAQNNFSAAQQDSIKLKMSELTAGFYETARWMLMNNKKSPATP